MLMYPHLEQTSHLKYVNNSKAIKDKRTAKFRKLQKHFLAKNCFYLLISFYTII